MGIYLTAATRLYGRAHDARVCLADVPFIRLRGVGAEVIRSGRASPRQGVPPQSPTT